jgi:hypothetical protein
MADKKGDSVGHQLADMVARPIGLHISPREVKESLMRRIVIYTDGACSGN